MKNDEEKDVTQNLKSTPKYDLDLDAIEQSDSKILLPSNANLTLRQWQELNKKDAKLLSPLQQRQLEETNKMLNYCRAA